MHKIIFSEPCDKCDHGVIPYMDKMGFEECDCIHGDVYTEVELPKEQWESIKNIVTIIKVEVENKNEK